MILRIRTLTVATVTAAMLALTGCGFMEPTPTVAPTPTPTATPIDTTTYIGEVIDPANTVWSGRDSAGDDTTFTLHEDGTVATQYGANSYDDPNDTWTVSNGILHIVIHIDDTHGNAEYTGTWNAATSTIDTVMTTTVSKRSLNVTLVQQ